MEPQTIAWVTFGILVAGALAADLIVFHRRPHVQSMREALGWLTLWVSLAVGFGIFVYYWRGPTTALQFFTGYILEESLSVDNMFVFLVIFSYFAVPRAYQHKVLFWGIFGALVMRAVLILVGVVLIQRFHWILYVFGVLLLLTGVRLAFQKREEMHPERNPILRLMRRLLPVTNDYEGSRFLVRRGGKLMATPMFVVLVVIETTDLMFALDSIPAVLAITQDPFIVYTSNIFAILGLRALFFTIAGAMELFHHLHYGLSVILVFIGIKILISEFFRIPIGIALGVVAGVLAISVLTSLVDNKRRARRSAEISPEDASQ